MKTPLGFSLLVLAFFLPALVPPVAADMGQPRMTNAIERLEAAKTAANPLPHLEAARKALKNARSNKEGQRVDALGFVIEAIAYARAREKGRMIERIDKAIANAKSGMARSGPR